MAPSRNTSFLPLVFRIPTPYLICIPIGIVCTSVVLFSRILVVVVESCSASCSSVSEPVTQTACFFAAFFKQCLATEASAAFIVTFLSFVFALLTVSHVEASRILNQPSAILTRPSCIWFAVNVMTGAIVTTVVLIASIKRRRDEVGEPQNGPRICEDDEHEDEVRPLIAATTANATGSPTAFSTGQTCQLVSLQRTYAIPISITLGFVIPSVILVVHPSPLVASLWNFFPVAIWAIKSLTLRVVGDERRPYYAERDLGCILRLYAPPSAFSLLAHFYLVYIWLWDDGTQTETAPATRMMLINFWMIIMTYLYWLLIDSRANIVIITILVAFVAGPGAGISVGWVLKELSVAEDGE